MPVPKATRCGGVLVTASDSGEFEERKDNKVSRRSIGRALWYSIALTLVAYAVYSQHSQLVSALHELAHIRWQWLAVAAFAGLAALYLCRMQRRLLRAGGTRITRRTSLALVFAQSATSMSFPGGAAISTS